MRFKTFLGFTIVVLLATACIPLNPATPTIDGTATQDALNPSATQTAAAFITATPFAPGPTETLAPETSPTTEVSQTPTPPSQSKQQFLAYISSEQLLVTDVTNNIKGGTTQYTVAGESDQVTDLVWSPSGEFVAFVAAPQGEQHIFYIFALGQSSPTDLGPGSAPAWSPDSTSIAFVGGSNPDNNIWITTIDNPAPRQLTFESNYAWGRPAFTPDGQSLVVAGANRNDMGAQGNTTFSLEYLELDGSGTRTPLPGATQMSGVRLPMDLSFSPNSNGLAFSTSSHLNACAAPGAYYLMNSNGSSLEEIVSPSLKAAIDPAAERYHVGLSYDWHPSSDAIVALGNVVDCSMSGPTPGQVIAGPQMSIISFDESERLIIPGFFYGISVDRTGNLIAAAHFQNGFQDLNPSVEIYSAQTGQLILPIGPGSNPQFQP